MDNKKVTPRGAYPHVKQPELEVLKKALPRSVARSSLKMAHTPRGRFVTANNPFGDKP